MPKLALIFILLLITTQLHAQPARVVCADIAPFCHTENGIQRGFALEIGQEIMRRLDEIQPIEIQPLARALHTVTNEKRIISLWVGRVPDRENMVQWVYPILTDYFYIFTLKGKPEANSLENARNLEMLGANIAAANTLAAQINGLYRIETTSSDDANGRKLLAGRIDGWVTLQITSENFLRKHQLEANTLTRGINLMEYSAYIVASQDLEKEAIIKWINALQAMRKDGQLAWIMRKYGISAKHIPQDTKLKN